jgi:hypothetical protein
VEDARATRELPLNGRDWTQLAPLQPGVSAIRTQNSLNGISSNRGSRGFGSEVGIAGGVVNAVSRSGTNVVHGDAYEFVRNDKLDARNFFDEQKPPFRRIQFGAAVGGPVKHGKTFLLLTTRAFSRR